MIRAADLLKAYRKTINPPYETKDLVTIFAILFILIVIPLTALVVQQQFRLVTQAAIWQPTPGTTWQWQLTGTIDTSYDVQMYDIDLFNAPQSKIDQLHSDGRIVICYFSAGSWEDWRPDANGFPDSVKGSSNGWPGEKWLDIRQLDILGPIMEDRMDLAVQKNCDGLEPDNIDGWDGNNTGFPLTADDQLTYNRWLATQAHERNLSIGLKNDLGQVNQLLNDFDWALDEECFEWDGCEALLPFISAGKAIFHVEYNKNTSQFCPQANAWGFSSMKKRLDLDEWMEPCWTTSADTTPPNVSITSPAHEYSVSGTVNVQATVSDNVELTSVMRQK